MSFPALSVPKECATSPDLTVRHTPITVCDMTDFTVRLAPIYASSCAKAIDFTNENVFEIFNYVGSVQTDESYDWTYHGWQKTHNYTVNDVCPF